MRPPSFSPTEREKGPSGTAETLLGVMNRTLGGGGAISLNPLPSIAFLTAEPLLNPSVRLTLSTFSFLGLACLRRQGYVAPLFQLFRLAPKDDRRQIPLISRRAIKMAPAQVCAEAIQSISISNRPDRVVGTHPACR